MHIWQEYFSTSFTGAPAGFLSAAHLLQLGIGYLCATLLAVTLGRSRRHRTEQEKRLVLRYAAVFQLFFAALKIAADCIDAGSPAPMLLSMPFYLCSIMFVALPLVAFGKSRVARVMTDFVAIFGVLAAVAGAAGAAYIYKIYPALHIHTLECLLTHVASGFAALYIWISHLATFRREDVPLTAGVLGAFMILAVLSNALLASTPYPTNYMFFSRSDGTPFLLFEKLFGAQSILYALSTALAMWLWWGVAGALCSRLSHRADHTQTSPSPHRQQE